MCLGLLKDHFYCLLLSASPTRMVAPQDEEKDPERGLTCHRLPSEHTRAAWGQRAWAGHPVATQLLPDHCASYHTDSNCHKTAPSGLLGDLTDSFKSPEHVEGRPEAPTGFGQLSLEYQRKWPPREQNLTLWHFTSKPYLKVVCVCGYGHVLRAVGGVLTRWDCEPIFTTKQFTILLNLEEN